MKSFNGLYFYKLDKFHRKQLKDIEKDRLQKELNEEDYFRERISRFKIEILPSEKKTKSKDDGIDFYILYKDIYLLLINKKIKESLIY